MLSILEWVAFFCLRRVARRMRRCAADSPRGAQTALRTLKALRKNYYRFDISDVHFQTILRIETILCLC